MTIRISYFNNRLQCSFTEHTPLSEAESRGNRFYGVVADYESSFQFCRPTKECEDYLINYLDNRSYFGEIKYQLSDDETKDFSLEQIGMEKGSYILHYKQIKK